MPIVANNIIDNVIVWIIIYCVYIYIYHCWISMGNDCVGWFCLHWLYYVMIVGVIISSDIFKNFALLMFWIVIFQRITSPFIKRKHDNVMYMLCIFNGILLGGWQRSMIKWSNIYPYALQFVKQKTWASGNWYLLIVNVLKVFDFNIWWWYWKFFDIVLLLWHL
jgi:hypothetical protein